GNPVSVAVTFHLFVRGALHAMQGAKQSAATTESAILLSNVKGTMDRESYLPATLVTNEQGCIMAEPLKWGGSSDFVAFARATALIIVPADVKTIDEGSCVKILRLPQ